MSSVTVPLKKQIIFGLFALVIILAALEGSARTYEFFLQDCNLEKADTLKHLDYFLKRQICNDEGSVIYSQKPVLSIVPNQHLATVNINNDGFRGPEINTNDKYRIFMIGGSTVFGAGLPGDEYTIPFELEKLLKEKQVDIEVINAGISSITSFEELYYIKEKLVNYAPNMIIVYDGVNDIFYKKISEQKILNEEEEIKNYQRYLRTPVVFYRNILLPVINSEILDSPGKNIQHELYDETVSNKITLLWEKRMTEFCKISTENNFESIVIIQPALYTGKKPLSDFEKSIYEKNTHGEKTFEKIIQNSRNLNSCSLVLDFSNVFENISDGVYFDQVHVNNMGNKIIAKKIADEISFLINK